MSNRPSLLLLVLGFIWCIPVLGQEKEKAAAKEPVIKWYSFEDAYKLNKKKPRKIFVDVYTDWCGWCKRMDSETFENPVIAKYMAKHFYCVKLNAERKDTVWIDGVKFVNPNPANKRSTHQLANELLHNQMTYPSYVFLNEKGNFLTMVAGFEPPETFEVVLHFFGEDAYLQQSFDDYKLKFGGEIKK